MREKYLPDYGSVPTWELYSAAIRYELRQSVEEGRDAEHLRELTEKIAGLPRSAFQEELCDALFYELERLPLRPDYKYDEPDGLEEIRALRGKGAEMPLPVPEDIESRVRGAWLGRACGCLLGKPVEGWTREKIWEHLKKNGAYPLSGYIPKGDGQPGRGWVCELDGAGPMDDDTNYTVMACLCIIGRFGREFTEKDVADTWLRYQPRDAYCTAERAAFRNFLAGRYPPVSAVYKNPYREWIGAQIRGDYFGYICPGDPESAAAMAWKDARISHVKNGIYGEMFAAAMCAAAAVLEDPREIILAGLREIPEGSRLAEAVNEVLDWHEQGLSAPEALEKIHGRYDEKSSYDWCHTIPNAMIVAAALLWGGLDFGRTVCLAVDAGFDTDCNAATAGSVLGMRIGAEGISGEWTAPLNGKLDTALYSHARVEIEALVQKTMEHIAAWK